VSCSCTELLVPVAGTEVVFFFAAAAAFKSRDITLHSLLGLVVLVKDIYYM
jgi:hypothetical protein